ncbi:MAG: histidinol-phosphate aminotransferase family protein [Flavobacteriales bacterium]|nr:histidinol-phosphate aminotransferase family protein [Flavobacteriales bacterium]
MITLDNSEIRIAAKLNQLKDEAGSHSPSIFTLIKKVPEISIKVDACFLSNPYATDLFLEYLKRELVDTNSLRDVLEFYPSQNSVIAELLAKPLSVNKENIFIGNGAIEVIQAVLHYFGAKKLAVNIPTFSSYYEFAQKDTEVIFYPLKKENNYKLDTEEYIKFIKDEKPDSIVIINPNNPDGQYVKYEELRKIITELIDIKNIIIDESFIHFAYESNDYSLISATELVKEFNNVIVIKSMSKDFGIAGIRAGYGVMDKFKVNSLLEDGYLWNSNGIAEYFFRLYTREDFLEEYEKVRIKYIKESQYFFNELIKIPKIKVYPGLSNFVLIELLDGTTSSIFVSKMLIKYGIYTRTCSDKIGLQGEYIRLASRTKEENEIIIEALKDIFTNEC